MKKFIIGALVLLVGVPGFALTFPNFLNFLAGVIPAVLILGGAVAVYLGFEESKHLDDSGTTVETEIELGAERLAKYAEKSKEVSEPALNEIDTTPAPEPTEEAKEAAAEEVRFKGNIETLVFHTVDCNFASGKNCSMDFTSKEEAETQGYKPCKICMPDS
nr:Ada metal-binding domain-containing protein [uncultured Desulfobacter sp.]